MASEYMKGYIDVWGKMIRRLKAGSRLLLNAKHKIEIV